MILCINFIVLSFTGEIPQGVFLGGCLEIAKVGRFMICILGFRVFFFPGFALSGSFRLLFSGFFFRQSKVSIKVSITCS